MGTMNEKWLFWKIIGDPCIKFFQLFLPNMIQWHHFKILLSYFKFQDFIGEPQKCSQKSYFLYGSLQSFDFFLTFSTFFNFFNFFILFHTFSSFSTFSTFWTFWTFFNFFRMFWYLTIVTFFHQKIKLWTQNFAKLIVTYVVRSGKNFGKNYRQVKKFRGSQVKKRSLFEFMHKFMWRNFFWFLGSLILFNFSIKISRILIIQYCPSLLDESKIVAQKSYFLGSLKNPKLCHINFSKNF